jgi:hypothetical protein
LKLAGEVGETLGANAPKGALPNSRHRGELLQGDEIAQLTRKAFPFLTSYKSFLGGGHAVFCGHDRTSYRVFLELTKRARAIS